MSSFNYIRLALNSEGQNVPYHYAIRTLEYNLMDLTKL